MKNYIVKENKIIGQLHDGYEPKDGETILIVKPDEWPILKRTGGEFKAIHKDDKKEGDIPSGGVTKFKVLRDKKEVVIDRDKKLETDKLIDFVYPKDMIRVYRGGTSILTIGTDFDCNAEAIEHKFTKNELYVLNGKAEIKTPEMQVVEIRDKARIKLLEMKHDIDAEEKKKVELTEIEDWTTGDEAKLTDMKLDYEKAVEDYNNIKTQLMQNIGNEVNFNAKKIELKDTFAKYNIKV
jgi:hypothetical protein